MTNSTKHSSHPLQQPLRQASPDSRDFGRFHNYLCDSCKKHLDPTPQCPVEHHEHCHNCLQARHNALASCGTPKFVRTKPKRERARSVLGDEFWWMGQLGYPQPSAHHEWQEGDDQLLRCRTQKKLEASLLLTLPPNSSYVDAGAHFGDSVVTMAVHARRKGRTDLRFWAFEPSTWKCEWMEKVAKANGLKITVINAAVRDQEQFVQPQVNRNGTPKQRSLFNGSLRYEPARSNATTATTTAIRMTTLDHYLDEISPLGILHLDVEGMGPQALQGALSLLKLSSRPSYIVAEAWDDEDCKKRGVELDAAERIDSVIRKYNKSVEPSNRFTRGPDMVDRERNLFYSKT